MSLRNYEKIKNIAIVAHVDHGKTTLVDCLLQQSGTYQLKEGTDERIMDSGELEREKGITIKAKNCAIFWNDTKINLMDTPGHADFGGEVERSLTMVDSVLLLVDAAEGPLPQTRFVLLKALERKLRVAVVINKVDRPDQRTLEVRREIEDLFLELAAMLGLADGDWNLDIPFLYASAKEGWASRDVDCYQDLAKRGEKLKPLLDFIVSDFFPSPAISPGVKLQLLVSNLSYSQYLGPLVIGRIQRGFIRKGDNYVRVGEAKNGKNGNSGNNGNNCNTIFKVSAIKVFDALGETEREQVFAGEIVIVAGLENANIGDSICASDVVEPLPRLRVDPPTVSVNVSVNTSPFSGKEGNYLTSRQLEEFLKESIRINVALRYEPTDDPKIYTLKGRGEFQLAIVFEELRRKGYEFMVSRPEVLFKKYSELGDDQSVALTTEASSKDDNSGDDREKMYEPFEQLVVDIPSKFTGIVTEALAVRKGQMKNMYSMIGERTRIDFVIPTRGLIGYRSQFLTDTRGEGLMSSFFLGYFPFLGKMLSRQNGAMIADRSGKATPYALFNLLSNGKQFIRPGDDVYEGMIVGEHTRTNDININAVREKHLSSVRTAGKDENVILPPVREMSLEFALDWIENDEWVEVTPKKIRIRKKILQQNQRSVIRK
ncbi:MAG: GTP-binding protein [Oligoflexia bacterium]|nr:GTP-binding protein [Oligoflexia bacterium]